MIAEALRLTPLCPTESTSSLMRKDEDGTFTWPNRTGGNDLSWPLTTRHDYCRVGSDKERNQRSFPEAALESVCPGH